MGNIYNSRHHQKDLERLRNFRLLDDDFMTKVFDGQTEETALILRIILENPNIVVLEVSTQKEIKNLQGRSACLDILAIDENKRLYNVEIQRADNGAGAKRARYNSSLMDANAIESGNGHGDLPETYVIFITENDVLGKGFSLYHIERIISETDELFEDMEHIVYVNGAYQGSDDVGKLMHDFRETNPDEMYFTKLADRTRYFKEDERGVAAMCKAMEDMRNETAFEMLLSLLRKGVITLEDAMNEVTDKALFKQYLQENGFAI